jgi:hypothetical protein
MLMTVDVGTGTPESTARTLGQVIATLALSASLTTARRVSQLVWLMLQAPTPELLGKVTFRFPAHAGTVPPCRRWDGRH